MLKFTVLVSALLLLAGCGTGAAQANYRHISQEEAASIMESEADYVILDVRTPEEFAVGHIPGAINIANETIGKEEIPMLPQKDQKILVYCRSGHRSRQAAGKLAALGYTNLLEFGGINTWSGPVVTE